MARRNPANPRYRKDSQVGSTRRSAASAKPKRDAGEAPAKSSSSRSSGSGSSAPKKGRFFEALPSPDTPEFRRLRTIWLVLFLIGAVGTLVALIYREPPISNIALIVAYLFLFAAILVDMLKVRPMRRDWAAKQKESGRK